MKEPLIICTGSEFAEAPTITPEVPKLKTVKEKRKMDADRKMTLEKLLCKISAFQF
jgi:hypothetical protein